MLIVGILCITYLYLKSQAPFKQYANLPQVKPHWFLGNGSFGGESMIDTYTNHYNALKGNRYGIFWQGNDPAFHLMDLELIKKVQISDFDHFMDLGFAPEGYSEKVGKFFGIADESGEKWRRLKKMVTPPFSVPRLKKTTPTINIAVKKMMNYFHSLEKKGEVVDATLALKKFYMTTIASVAFGTDIDCFTDETNEFMRNGDNLLEMWRFVILALWPSAMVFFKIGLINEKASNFFSRLFKQILAQRRETNVVSKDIMGNMMEAAKENPELTEDMMIASFVQFFTDGYSTAADIFSICIYQLTNNPDVQERAQEQIDEVLEGKEGIEDIPNEDIEKMSYIDQILDETLRMGTAPFTARICTKEWKFPGEDLVIPKGKKVIIPIMGLQHDPEYFEDPYKFDPERFSSENKGNIPTGAYQPFGMGPRMCLGYNIIKLETKIMLVHLLRNFSLKKHGDMPEKIVWDKNTFLGIVGGVNIKLAKRT